MAQLSSWDSRVRCLYFQVQFVVSVPSHTHRSLFTFMCFFHTHRSLLTCVKSLFASILHMAQGSGWDSRVLCTPIGFVFTCIGHVSCISLIWNRCLIEIIEFVCLLYRFNWWFLFIHKDSFHIYRSLFAYILSMEQVSNFFLSFVLDYKGHDFSSYVDLAGASSFRVHTQVSFHVCRSLFLHLYGFFYIHRTGAWL